MAISTPRFITPYIPYYLEAKGYTKGILPAAYIPWHLSALLVAPIIAKKASTYTLTTMLTAIGFSSLILSYMPRPIDLLALAVLALSGPLDEITYGILSGLGLITAKTTGVYLAATTLAQVVLSSIGGIVYKQSPIIHTWITTTIAIVASIVVTILLSLAMKQQSKV